MKLKYSDLVKYYLLDEFGKNNVQEEYKFNHTRRWRFDFALPKHKIGTEIEGSVWVQGRHTRGSGFIKDCEKYNYAAIQGWCVLRYPTDTPIYFIVADIKKAIEERSKE